MRLQRDVTALRKGHDPQLRSHALVLLGVIEALRFDTSAAKAYFDQALSASGYDSNVYVNYAATLSSLGFFTDALPMIEKAVDKLPEVDTLRLAVKFASNAFAIDKVVHYARWLERLKVPDDDPEVRRALESAAWQRAILEAPGITRGEVLRRYELARSVARDYRVRIAEERANTSTRGVLVEWPVDCDDEGVSAMNYAAVQKLSQLEADPCELLISFGFIPASALAPAPA